MLIASNNQNKELLSQLTLEQNQICPDMEIESPDAYKELYINGINDIVPDLTEIEEEIINDANGNVYLPERFSKCFIPKNELAKNVSSIALKFILAKKKLKDRSIKSHGPKEVYIINRLWYNKWKNYSRYSTMKRIIKAYDTYEKRPIEFIPNESKFPGKINNNDLLIRNKINEDGRNILVSKYNDSIDTKFDYQKDIKLLAKERFDLLNDYFKCDYILKGKIIQQNDTKNYDIFFAHFKLIFLPTLSTFKNVNDENIENFKNNQNIIYDIYFKQSDTIKEIMNELINILKEKPEILSNMGIELIMKNDEDEITNHIKNFKFYIPSSRNSKNAKEMADFIFSNSTIEKIKKNEKIGENDLSINAVEYIFDLSKLFNLSYQNNMDEISRGTFFVEYVIQEDSDTENVSSIFDIQNDVNYVITEIDDNIRK